MTKNSLNLRNNNRLQILLHTEGSIVFFKIVVKEKTDVLRILEFT
ncbi:hypothetical protein SMITH_238 [Smithella sp. ME-1]|nr:hypothetical protein SMITH_238 [Smithella sp. ME-1]